MRWPIATQAALQILSNHNDDQRGDEVPTAKDVEPPKHFQRRVVAELSFQRRVVTQLALVTTPFPSTRWELNELDLRLVSCRVEAQRK